MQVPGVQPGTASVVRFPCTGAAAEALNIRCRMKPEATVAAPATEPQPKSELPSNPLFDAEEETTLENPPAPAPAPAPPAKKHKDRHVKEALSYGFSPAAIEAASPEELHKALVDTREWLAREMAAVQRNDVRMSAVDARNAPKQQPVAQPEPPKDELDLEDAESWDPKMRTLFATVKQLRDENATLKEGFKKREERDFDAIVDNAFANLPPKFKSLLGEGTLAELMEAGDTKAQMRRRSVFIASGVAKGKYTPKKIAELIAAAADMLFDVPEQTPAPAGKTSLYAGGAAPETATPHHSTAQQRDRGRFGPIDPEAWNASGAARPVQRVPQAEPDGKKKATENLARRLEEMGYSASGDVSADDFL